MSAVSTSGEEHGLFLMRRREDIAFRGGSGIFKSWDPTKILSWVPTLEMYGISDSSGIFWHFRFFGILKISDNLSLAIPLVSPRAPVPSKKDLGC